MAIKAKALLKQFFYKAGGASLLDWLLFRMAASKYGKANRAFRKTHKDWTIPPDYFLYETCLLDYDSYFTSGQLGAQEIMDWTAPWLKVPGDVLEWGCGVSRIVRHLPALVGPGTAVHACDINQEMIDWNKANIKDVVFTQIPYEPPTAYPSGQFKLVYAISVFTHIEAAAQQQWLQEMARLLKPGGVFLFTTHGTQYDDQLLPKEKKLLDTTGVFVKSYRKKGHRMMTAYNRKEVFEQWLQGSFRVLAFYRGTEHPDMIGGQDLWIVQKG